MSIDDGLKFEFGELRKHEIGMAHMREFFEHCDTDVPALADFFATVERDIEGMIARLAHAVHDTSEPGYLAALMRAVKLDKDRIDFHNDFRDWVYNDITPAQQQPNQETTT